MKVFKKAILLLGAIAILGVEAGMENVEANTWKYQGQVVDPVTGTCYASFLCVEGFGTNCRLGSARLGFEEPCI